MHLEDYITPRHIDVMCKLVLLTERHRRRWPTRPSSSSRFYSGNPYEQFVFLQPRARARSPGPTGPW